MSRIPADSEARQRALDPALSCAVSAPAGSGKTGLLTQRVLTLLPLCEHPEEVVCITFTRKAAAEMQQRIGQAIAAAAGPAPDDPHQLATWNLARRVLERDRECGWNLLHSPQRLRIQTIDGFCRSLTLMNPMSSTIGGSTRMLDNPRRAYRAAAEATLAQLESDSGLGDDLEQLFLHLDNDRDRILGLLTNLLANRDQWLEPLLLSRQQGARAYFEGVLRDLLEETLGDLQRQLLPWASDLCQLADYAAANCAVDAPGSGLCDLLGLDQLPPSDASGLELWRRLSELLLTATGDWRKPGGLNKKCGFPAGSGSEGKQLAKARKQSMAALLQQLAVESGLLDGLRLLRRLPPPRYHNEQWRLLDSLTRILPLCVSQLKLEFRKLNAADFSEIAQGALLALGDQDLPSDLGLALDYQIRHILVDEFQDTSTTQWRLLERLTEGWQPGDGRSLFIVGDGMQSCYGFRNANVGLFLDARRSGIGQVDLQALDLQVNFRSRGGVVDWVNQVFRQAFPVRDDISRGAVSYADSLAWHPAAAGAAVETHIQVDAADGRAEAERVVELVRASLARDPHGRVAILVRDRGRLRDILPALQRADIPWQANAIDPLSSRMTIVDLITLTRAISDCSDRNAWLALLRCPWIGLDNGDLLLLANQTVDGEASERMPLWQAIQRFHQLAGLSNDGRRILGRCVPLLQLAREQRRRKSLRHTLEGLWTALGGPAGLADSAELGNADDFFDLLERHEEGGRIGSWEDFHNAVQQLFARPQAAADVRVEVMTIHKSKGLEFETVIIPGLERASRPDEHQLLLWRERISKRHAKQLLLSPLSATGNDPDPLYHYLQQENRLQAQLESTRLFYVGCTRAIERLYLLASLSTDSRSGNLKAPPQGSLLAAVWPGVQDDAILHVAGPATASAPAAPQTALLRRLSPHWQSPPLVPGSLLAAYRGREFDADDNLASDEPWRQRRARYVGQVLHRTLAQVVREGPQQWQAERIRRQVPFWLAQLRQLGLAGSALNDAATQVELGLRRTLDDPRGRWVLDPEHPQSAVEASYWSARGGQSIVDRTFVCAGERWIVDYKSSTPEDGESLATFCAREAAAYGTQLARYRALFSGTEPVRTALYFPLCAHLHELESECGDTLAVPAESGRHE